MAGEGEKSQLATEFALHVLALFGVEVIPLVDADDERATGFEDEAGDVRVLVADVLPRVEQENDHVRVLNRLERLDDRKLLDLFDDLAATANARGVDQRVRLAAALEIEVDRIARRAGLVERDHALFAEQHVDQRRLADVRPADERDARGRLLVPRDAGPGVDAVALAGLGRD